MSRILFCLSFLITFSFCSNTWAFYTESLIYTGPPEYGEPYDYNEEGATHVYFATGGREAEVSAGWWVTGGRLQRTWDSSQQGFLYIFSDIDKDFVVTSAGPASITFSWEGFLQVTGSTDYNDEYNMYANAYVNDSTSTSIFPVIDWYYEINSIGSQNIFEMDVLNYVFDEDDIGSSFNISMVFESMVSPNQTITFNGDDSLNFNSDTFEGFKIESITGGIAAAEGPALSPVPIPGAVWLLGSGLIGLAGLRRKAR